MKKVKFPNDSLSIGDLILALQRSDIEFLREWRDSRNFVTLSVEFTKDQMMDEIRAKDLWGGFVENEDSSRDVSLVQRGNAFVVLERREKSNLFEETVCETLESGVVLKIDRITQRWVQTAFAVAVSEEETNNFLSDYIKHQIKRIVEGLEEGAVTKAERKEAISFTRAKGELLEWLGKLRLHYVGFKEMNSFMGLENRIARIQTQQELERTVAELFDQGSGSLILAPINQINVEVPHLWHGLLLVLEMAIPSLDERRPGCPNCRTVGAKAWSPIEFQRFHFPIFKGLLGEETYMFSCRQCHSHFVYVKGSVSVDLLFGRSFEISAKFFQKENHVTQNQLRILNTIGAATIIDAAYPVSVVTKDGKFHQYAVILLAPYISSWLRTGSDGSLRFLSEVQEILVSKEAMTLDMRKDAHLVSMDKISCYSVSRLGKVYNLSNDLFIPEQYGPPEEFVMTETPESRAIRIGSDPVRFLGYIDSSQIVVPDPRENSKRIAGLKKFGPNDNLSMADLIAALQKSDIAYLRKWRDSRNFVTLSVDFTKDQMIDEIQSKNLWGGFVEEEGTDKSIRLVQKGHTFVVLEKGEEKNSFTETVCATLESAVILKIDRITQRWVQVAFALAWTKEENFRYLRDCLKHQGKRMAEAVNKRVADSSTQTRYQIAFARGQIEISAWAGMLVRHYSGDMWRFALELGHQISLCGSHDQFQRLLTTELFSKGSKLSLFPILMDSNVEVPHLWHGLLLAIEKAIPGIEPRKPGCPNCETKEALRWSLSEFDSFEPLNFRGLLGEDSYVLSCSRCQSQFLLIKGNHLVLLLAQERFQLVANFFKPANRVTDSQLQILNRVGAVSRTDLKFPVSIVTREGAFHRYAVIQLSPSIWPPAELDFRDFKSIRYLYEVKEIVVSGEVPTPAEREGTYSLEGRFEEARGCWQPNSESDPIVFLGYVESSRKATPDPQPEPTASVKRKWWSSILAILGLKR